MYVTFRQLSSKILRSKTFAKAIVSKESFRGAVCECAELKDPVDDKESLGGMVPVHI